MVHMQIVSRGGENLQGLLREAIRNGKIKSFLVKHVRGGLVIQHRKYIGEIRFTRTTGPLIAALKCQNRSREWQLLGALVGRLGYHFKNEIAGVNIQFEPEV